MERLIPEVRGVRSKLDVCPAAKEGVCITEILEAIVEKQAYKKDYEEITMGLLFITETYDTVIQSIQKLINSGVWN